jgi:hypothetical protein
MNRYDALNAAKRTRGLFDLDTTGRRAAIRNIDAVRDAVREEIENIGASNPEALNAWRNGVEAFAVVHRSQALSNYARQVAQGPYAKLAAGTTFGLFGGGTAALSKLPLSYTGAGAVAVPAIYKTGQVAYRVWKSPTLARYYWNALDSLRNENQDAFIKNANALERAYNKEYPREAKEKSKQIYEMQ